jgi:hypothetical protein
VEFFFVFPMLLLLLLGFLLYAGVVVAFVLSVPWVFKEMRRHYFEHKQKQKLKIVAH